MRNAAKSVHVKRDYLIRLAPFRYRGDTNRGHSDAFIASSPLSVAWKAFLEREERVDRLARAHFVCLAAIDQHFAGTRA